MKAAKKMLSFILVFVLMLNLLHPGMIASAEGQTADKMPTVTGSTYGGKQQIAGLAAPAVTNSVYKGAEIITSIKIKVETSEGWKDIESVRPGLKDRVRVDLNWMFEDQHPYQPGDKFEFYLPDNFEPMYNEELLKGILKLKDEDEDTEIPIGTYEITPDGKVTWIFNEIIADGTEVSGSFFVERYFDESKLQDGTKQTIEFKDSGQQAIEVQFKRENGGDPITKSGKPNKKMNASEIEWVVDFNLDELSIEEAEFTDTVKTAGLTFVPGSVKIYPLIVNIKGAPVPGAETHQFTPVISPDQKQLDIDFGDIEGAYRVVYTTQITGAADAEYKNEAIVSGSGNPKVLETEKGVVVNYSKPLNKSGSAAYNGIDKDGKHTANWRIEYNYNEQPIKQAEAYVIDTLTGNHELDEDSIKVYKVAIDDNGQPILDQEPLKKGADSTDGDYTVTRNGNSFTLQFNEDIKAGYQITYVTHNKDRVIDENVELKNEVEMPNEAKKDAAVKIGQVVFHKSNSEPNYKDKTIAWTIKLNQDKQPMKDVVIEDSFAGQPMVLQGEVKVYDASGQEVTTGFKIDKTDGTGFKLSFDSEISEAYTIKYTTKFDSTKPVPVHNDGIGYQNGAGLTWISTADNQSHTINKKVLVPVDNYTTDNGNKVGVYDASSKTITWTVDINYNLHEIANAIVTDEFNSPQKLVFGSMKVYELELNGGKDGIEVGNEVNKSAYSLTEKPNGYELTLGKIDTAYRLIYETTLEGELVDTSYTNVAVLKDGPDGTEKLFEKGYKVIPPYTGEYIFKEGRQGEGAQSDLALWTIHINRNQSKIAAGSELKDKLSDNQMLLKDSFKLYTTTVEANGSVNKSDHEVSPDKYEIKIEGNEFVLTFKEEIEEPYVLEYASFINANNGDRITNDASYQSKHSAATGSDQQAGIRVVFWEAGGSGSIGIKTTLEIKKVGSDGRLLPGAKFELYDKSGKNLIAAAITDQSGVAAFANVYEKKEYVLKEAEAPAGYLISPQYEQGQIIKGKPDQPIEIVNQKIVQGFEATKLSEDGTGLAGAQFELQIETANGDYEPVLDTGQNPAVPVVITSDGHGRLTMTDLPAGNYQLVEKVAPAGYQLDETPVQFKITPNQTSLVKLDNIINKIIKGSVELIKVDSADKSKPIEGAEFKLLDKQGAIVRSGLLTDAAGKITVTDLVYGDYQFVEVKPAPDYQDPVDPAKAFSITTGQMVELVMENTLKTGSIKVVKVAGDDHAEKLAGAKFTLLDSSNKVALDADGKRLEELVTDADGELIIDKLAPGDYKLVEIEAPAGYVKDSRAVSITVLPDKQTEQTFENTKNPFGAVQLTKVEKGDAAKKLAYAQFKITAVNGNTVVEGLTTGKDGILVASDLPAGDYQFVETNAPNGYELDDAPIPFTIKPGQKPGEPVQVTAENELKQTGKAKLIKVEQGAADVKLEGAVFKLVHENGEVVKDKDNKELAGLVTDRYGEIVVTDLPLGKYQFVETEAPDGYIVNKAAAKFEIKPGQKDEEYEAVTVANELKPYGDVKLIKVNESSPAKRLAGAVFNLVNDQGEIVADKAGSKLEGLTTDENGEINLSDLPAGNYQFIETKAPAGYVKNNDPVPFEIKKGQKQGEYVTVTVVNSYEPYFPWIPPTDPVEPKEPADPDKPDTDNPDKPGTEEPGNPGNPDPDNPDKGDPGKPENPGGSEKPEKPGKPDKPDKPGKPSKPGDPEKPGKPATPDEWIEGDIEVPRGGIAEIGKQPKNGKVTIDKNGKWVYKRNPGAKGKDKFTVLVTNKDGEVEEILIEIDEGIPTGGISLNEKQPSVGGVLPKTGEDSPLPIQLAGLALILIGFAALRKVRRKQQ